MGTISLEAAIQAHEQTSRENLQTARDLAAALDAAICGATDQMALGNAVRAMSYLLKHGWTPEARRQITSSRRMCRAALGIEDEA